MPSIPVLQSGYKEVYVRRAIALLARKREVYHNNRFRLTGAGLVPILPLVVSPLPNLPIYYVGYRVYSHHSARDGARTVLALLKNKSDAVRQDVRAAVEVLRAAGTPPRPGSWAEHLAASADNCRDTCDQGVNGTFEFRSSTELDALSRRRDTCVRGVPALTPSFSAARVFPNFLECRKPDA